MNWLMEQPLIIIVAGAVVVLVLFGILHQTGQKWALYAMVAVAVIFAGLVALERSVVTPGEAVRATLYEIARDAQANDHEAVIGHISKQAPQIQQDAQTKLKPVRLQEVTVKRISHLKVHADANPPTASVQVLVKAVGGDRLGTLEDQAYFQEFAVDLVLESDDHWRVSDYREVDTDLLQ